MVQIEVVNQIQALCWLIAAQQSIILLTDEDKTWIKSVI